MIWTFLIAAFAQSSGSFLSPGPLAQAHADLDTITQCTVCHAPLQGVDPSRCMACHERVKQQVDTKTGFHATKQEACGTCHADHRGLDADIIRLRADTFDHSETGFDLTGKHDELECTDCHKSDTDWTDLNPECEACHRDVHGSVESSRPLLQDCEACHHTGGWRTEDIPLTTFDHTDAKQVDYVVTDAHTGVDCIDCHFDFRFVPTPHERCVDCHSDPHRAPFDEKCEACHVKPTTWKVPGFDHDRTPFKIEGQHAEVDCFGCHKGNRTVPLAYGACSDCHEDVHRGQFAPQACTECHTVQVPKFALPDFDHATTKFPLEGEHASQGCEECHGEAPYRTYRPVEHEDCVACHEDFHDGHFQPTPCKVCHIETGWGVAEFDHARTEFPLTGAHEKVECDTCHANNVYAGLPHGSCADCHTETPHDGTLKQPCEECHATTSFAEIAFQHALRTGFELTPPHHRADCKDCHEQTRDFLGAPDTCTGCHEDDRPWSHYEGTCDGCHQGAAWMPAGLGSLDHAVTGFPLSGQHAATPCEDCHTPGTARGSTPDDCASCHKRDDPHRNLLGDQCSDCHYETSWFKTRFRHLQTGWPLTGVHRIAECSDCHAVSFVGTPTECWRCHEAEAPKDIEAHQSAFFALCQDCHNPYDWESVRYAH